MNDICQEVKRFLKELGRDLPDIFSYRPPAPRLSGPLTLEPPPSSRSPGEINRKQAGELIRARVKYLAAALGLEYGKIFIKDQRTLWASCSGRKNLNFNWRLAAAPPEILDYVVIHELCHLREMNHSKRFWGLVREVCPDYKARKKWLKNNGMSLKSGGASRSTANIWT
jgi:hypothetical protein